ncbi:MAG: NAD(P)H-dependent oxidoreductase [Actinomycetota bacterium]
MSQGALRIAVLVGSDRPNRIGGVVADWFLQQARQRRDMTFDVIDLKEVELPAVMPAGPDPVVEEYRGRIDAADGFVIITPEYNHGYPAAIKQAIDLAKTQWYAKPAGFVSYGGLAGGVRAVEQLRQVFAELHVVGVRDAVGLARVRHLFDERGELVDPDYPTDAASKMLESLSWWAQALKEAKAKRPYEP